MSDQSLLHGLYQMADPLLLVDAPTWLRRSSDKATRRRLLRPFREAHDLQVWPRDGSPRAALAFSKLPDHAFGFEGARLHLAADPRDPRAVQALASMIRTYEAERRFPLFCEPVWSLRSLVPELQRIGLGVDGLSLVGDVLTSLEVLSRHRTKQGVRACDHLGNECIVRRGTPDDVDAVLALRETLFQHPDEPWRWYVGRPADLARKRVRLSAEDSRLWVVEQQGVIGGYIHSAMHRHSFVIRHLAGIDVALAPNLRGFGLLKPLIRLALEDLWKRGIYAYSGLSSRPEVLRVAKQLERHPVRIAMRSGAPHDRTFFESSYPLE